MATIDELIRDFRIAAMEKGEAAGILDNELHDRLSACFHQLRLLGPPGHAAFRSLLRDDSPSVRAWVAAQLLAEGDIEALAILEELATGTGMGGFNAQMTVREYLAGRLKAPFGEPAA